VSVTLKNLANQLRSRVENGDLHAQVIQQASNEIDALGTQVAPFLNPNGAGSMNGNQVAKGFSKTQNGDVFIDTLGITNVTSRNECEDPPPIQIITGAGTRIIPLGRWVRISNTSGGPLTLTALPTIAASHSDGQYIAVTNIGPDTVTFQDAGTLAGSGLQLLAATVPVAQGQTLECRYITDKGINKWCQIGPVGAPSGGTVTTTGSPLANEVALFDGGTGTVIKGLPGGTTTQSLHATTGGTPFWGNVLESDIVLSTVTTNDSTTVKHGFLKQLDNNGAHYMDGQGNWTTPAGAGTVTSSGPPTIHQLPIFTGATDIKGISGTTNQLLHAITGADPAFSQVVEADILLANNTTNDASAANHGFLKQLDSNALHYMDGTGNWTTPAGAGTGTVTSSGPPTIHQVSVFTSASDIKGVSGSTNQLLHAITGSDPAFSNVVEADLGLTDLTTANSSTSAHGFLKKLDNTATHFMDGTGNWSTPANSGGTVTSSGPPTIHQLPIFTGATDVKGISGTTNQLLHAITGADPVFSTVVEADITLADNTTNNASASKHGFLKKLDGIVAHFMDGSGNWSTPGLPFLNAADYNFPAQAPGGSLTSGVTATVTLTPVPLGVNASDSNHPLYLSGGTGSPTPEAVTLVLGGTAVSGAATGTIKFNPGVSRTGAWTIQSATAGIQEAIQVLATSASGGTVLVPQGTNNVYGPITSLTTDLSVLGGGYPSIVQVNQTTGTVFTFAAGHRLSISNLTIQSSAANGVNVTAVSIGNNITAIAQNLWIAGLQNGIVTQLASTTNLDYISNVFVAGPFASSLVGVAFNIGCGNTFLINCTASSGARNDLLYGVLFNNVGGGSWVTGNDIFHASVGLAIIPSSGVAGEAWFTDNAWNASTNYGVLIQPTGTGAVEPLYFKGDEVSVAGAHGIVVGGGAGTVKHITFNGVTVLGAQNNGVYLGPNASNILLSNMNVHENGLATANTYAGLAVDAAVSNWSVVGGKFGGTAGGSGTGFASQQRYGIQVVAGASDHYVIQGANCENNTTAGIGDSGTGTHKSISDNLGVDTAAPATIASAATITLPNSSSFFFVSGSTTVTTINGGWIGRRITLVATGTVNIGGGGNVPTLYGLSANLHAILTYSGTNWY